MTANKGGRPKGQRPSWSFRLTNEEHEEVKTFVEKLRAVARRKTFRAKLKEKGLI